MKIAVRILVTVLCLATLFCGLSVFASDGAAQGEWRTDADGKERYYVNGSYVTGNYKVGNHLFTFAADGECLGAYDSYANPGVVGVMDTEQYKAAVDTREKYLNLTFDDPNFNYGKITQILRAANREAYDRGNGNLAYTFRHYQDVEKFNEISMAEGSNHSYLNMGGFAAFSNKQNVNGEFIIEFDLALPNLPYDYCNIITVIDRASDKDAGDDKFSNLDGLSLLDVNKEGYVYLSQTPDYIVCKLNSSVLTRISISIHKSSNTFDVYCNGVLILKDFPFYTGVSQTPEEFTVDECRMLQISGLDTSSPEPGQFLIDNLYIYGGSEPVCLTAGAQIKNGFCEDGAFLRYYENGVIRTGAFVVTGEFFGQTFNKKYVEFDSVTGKAYIGYNATVLNGGVVVSNSVVAEDLFEAPKAVDMDGKEFIGWNVGGRLVEAGTFNRISSNVTVEATGIGFSLVNGAAMSTKRNASELIFAAKISKADYAALTALGVTVEPHIVTVPTENLRAAYGYISPEHLAIEGLEAPVDTVATDWLDENDNYYFYGASVSGITDVTKEYSAVAYLKITLPNGNVIEVYADYNESNNSRTLYDVALSAYNDRTTVRVKGAYTKLVAYNGIRTYSPYGMIKRGHIKDVLDSMVVLKTDNNSVKASGDFYDEPYKLSYEPNETGYNVTVENAFGWKVEDVKGIIVDGELLPTDSYTASKDGFNFPVDSGKMFIYEAPKEVVPEGVRSWTLISSETDKNLFSSVIQLPGEADNGLVIQYGSQTKAYKWVYKSSKNLDLTNASAIMSTEKDGYYDMSSWKAMSFSVYVPTGFKGATFDIWFVSESQYGKEGKTDAFVKRVLLENEGWNDIFINQYEFGGYYTPWGWDKITSLQFDITTNEQANNTSTVLYISDITVYDQTLYNYEKGKSEVDKYSKEENAAIFVLDGYAGSIDGKTYKINPKNTDSRVFKEDNVVYLPVSVFAVSIDDGAAYYEKSGVVTYVYDEVKYTFSPGSTYKVGSEYRELTYPAIHRNGGLFISAQDAMAIYEYENIFEEEMGLIVLSNSEIELDTVDDRSTIYGYIKPLMYVRPTGEEMYSDLMQNSGGQHPYLMIDSEGFDELRYYYKTDATMQSYVEKIKRDYGIGSAEFKANTRYFTRYDGKRLLNVAYITDAIRAWGLLYHLDVYQGEEKQQIVDRAWKEIESYCNYYDAAEEFSRYSWNPSHYLDIGQAGVGMALAYDWFYDEWTPEQRSQIAKALYEYALSTTSVVAGGGVYRDLASLTNNWNGVCNSGIMAGALAIVNDPYIVSNGLQDEVIQVMDYGIEALESGMHVYLDGGYEEGTGYWAYGTTYVAFFMSSVISACGTSYGLYYTPGFEESAYFTSFLGNGTLTWTFHDADPGYVDPVPMSWFASVSKDPNLNTLRRQGLENGWSSSNCFDVMFFNPHLISNNMTFTLDAYYSLDTIMTFRSSWDSSNSIFAGLHGGSNMAGHGDLDIGNFVINVNGVFMIDELGSDGYEMAGYFNEYRWSYYRKRTEGQNCLVMSGHDDKRDDPKDAWNGKTGRPEYYVDANGNVVDDVAKAKYIVSMGVKYNLSATNGIGSAVENVSKDLPDPGYYGQKYEAVSELKAFESGINSAYGVVNMKSAYAAAKGDMLRGLYMTNNRSTVVIQDEGVFNSYQDIWWFAHTAGSITVSEDGRSAIIYRDGIYLYAEIVVDPNNPIDAKFSIMDAVSLDENYVGDKVFSGLFSVSKEVEKASPGKKLAITVENTKAFNCAVAFKQIGSPEEAPAIGSIYTWTPIKDWKAE